MYIYTLYDTNEQGALHESALLPKRWGNDRTSPIGLHLPNHVDFKLYDEPRQEFGISNCCSHIQLVTYQVDQLCDGQSFITPPITQGVEKRSK